MAGGPLFPTSAYPNDSAGRLFPNWYTGTNQGGTANGSPTEEGLGVKASLDADATWELRFAVPPSLPTGTVKLRLLSLANATSGAAKVIVKDGRVAAGGVPSGVVLTVETTQTVTWAAGNNDAYMELKVPLTGLGSLAGNDMVVVALTFTATGWTLAAVSTWVVSLIWE